MNAANDLMLDISQSLEVNASIDDVYEQLLLRLTEKSVTPDNQPMPMVLERWPGGRWYRNLGDDQGHWWGVVQVIKPPTLLELSGPMFMSYPATGHIQLRIAQLAKSCTLSLRHRVLGFVEDDHRSGLQSGWVRLIDDVRRMSENDG